MKQDIFPQVLKPFIDNMSVSKDQPGVLIMDNHNSHITIEAVELAKEHGLSLLTLPPHCSHKLQPLDVGVFGAFKKFYTTFCDEWHLSHPGETLSLYYVAELSNKAFVKSCTLENITSSFRRTGIFPFNSDIFTEDEFLPSTVTDQVENLYSDATTNESSLLDTTEINPGQSTSDLVSSTPDYKIEPNLETSLIESIAPLPKAKPRKMPSRKKVSSAIITHRPLKKKLFPQQAVRNEFSTDKEEVFVDSESDASLSDRNASLALHPVNLVMFRCGDFVIANVHTAAGKCKKFIGKLISGPDEDQDFEISFLERSKKIKNGFVFPEVEDLASIARKDIERVLPPPCAAAQTKRLCGVLKFDVNLSFV